MMTRPGISILTLLAFCAPVLAKAPADIADLVGARAAGAESEMQARGYEDVGGNSWWNAATKTCVRVHVSQGHYSAISQIKAAACGQAGGKATQCPPDLSQADLYKHPGCSL